MGEALIRANDTKLTAKMSNVNRMMFEMMKRAMGGSLAHDPQMRPYAQLQRSTLLTSDQP